MDHYRWAYVHPWGVRFFDRQWLIELLLWGQYGRLRDAALDRLGPRIEGRCLQVSCAYGDITPRLVQRMKAEACLDVIDILPIQLANLRRKLGHHRQVRMHRVHATALDFPSAHFDQVLVFFLFHEQPASVRAQTLSEVQRVLKPGGDLVVADYSRMHRWHPLHRVWKPLVTRLEPFSRDLFDHGLEPWLRAARNLRTTSSATVGGGLYEVVHLQRVQT